MRKTLRASVMVLALCGPAFAGDMQCPPVVPPPPAPAVQGPTTDGVISTPLTTDGEMPNGTSDGIMQNGASDGIMGNGAAATFLQVVLNLLALP